MNNLINGDCIEVLKTLESDSIDLIVSSPPYKEEDGYSEELIKSVAENSFRILKNNSLCFINFGHLAGNKLRPFQVATEFVNHGFELVDTIIWVKNHYTPLQGDKRLNNLSEFIFMFSKGKDYHLNRLEIGIPYADKSNIGRYSDKDLKCRGNVWNINYETIQNKSQKLHKDRFPVELPELCIKLSNIQKDSKVLDFFMGSATTGIACNNLDMNFIGIEKDLNIYEIAKERMFFKEKY